MSDNVGSRRRIVLQNLEAILSAILRLAAVEGPGFGPMAMKASSGNRVVRQSSESNTSKVTRRMPCESASSTEDAGSTTVSSAEIINSGIPGDNSSVGKSLRGWWMYSRRRYRPSQETKNAAYFGFVTAAFRAGVLGGCTCVEFPFLTSSHADSKSAASASRIFIGMIVTGALDS